MYRPHVAVDRGKPKGYHFFMLPSCSYSTSPRKRLLINLFLTILLLVVPLSLISQVNAQSATESGYSLIGTIRSGDFSGAVIKVAKGEQSFFRLFEKLPDGSQIVQVHDDSISLKGTDGTIYDMYISHEKIMGAAASPMTNNNASQPSSIYVGPTPAQQEVINRIKQQNLERARRRKKEDEEIR
jgi:hypothetical protein